MAAPKVRKAALIALDQLDGSPLRRADVPLLAARKRNSAGRDLRRLRIIPIGRAIVGNYLNARFHEPDLGGRRSRTGA